MTPDRRGPQMWAPTWRDRLLSTVTATEPGGTCVLACAPGYGTSTVLQCVAQTTRDLVTPLQPLANGSVWDALCAALGCDTTTAAGLTQVLARQGPRWLMIDAPTLDDEDLAQIAQSLPATTRLAVATHRSVVGGPSLAGRVLEINEDMFALRLDEATELLADLDLDVAEGVWAAAEGWLAAMLSTLTPLAAASGDPVQWLHGPGADRLFQSWFDALPLSRRDFLTATAVLDDLDVEVCNAVVGRDDSGTVLSALARDHCFVLEQTGPAGVQWRRHRLLTSFLRRRTEHTRTSVLSHSRAADWYREHDDVEATMRHLLASGRATQAGDFLREHEADLFRGGKAAEALDWYQQLPRAGHGHTAAQVLRVAWGHAYSAQLDDAEMWLGRLRCLVEDAAAQTPEQVDRAIILEAETDVLEAYIATFLGDVQRLRSAAESAVAAFDGGTERDSEQLSHLLLIKALQWSGEVGQARAHLDAVEHRQFANDMIRESTLGALRARQLRLEGRIHLAARVTQRASHWIDALGLDPCEMRLVNVMSERAAVLLERGDITGAEPALMTALDAQRRQQRTGDAATTLVDLARVRAVCGDAGAALRYMQQARAMLTATAPGTALLSAVDAAEARVRIAMGDAVRAERLIRALPRSEERTLLWSRLSLVRGGEVRRTLLALEPSTARIGAEWHLLRAWALRRRSLRVAEAHMLQAADIAVEHGQALLLADAGPVLLELAEETARRHSHDGLLELVSVMQQEPIRPAPSGPALSPGEMRLIPMLPTRDTVAQIAEQLHVTENTVKTRLGRLYRKLGVGSRDEAIAVARERGLL